MHQCLQIAEVVRNIVLGEDELLPVDLVSFALACRAFYEPAMDALWWTLTPNIASLLKLFPPSVLGYGAGIYGGLVRPSRGCVGSSLLRAQTLLAKPSPQDWARFNHHAPRVRELNLRDSRDRRIYDNAYWTLASHHPGPYLLPNLRAFSCWMVYPGRAMSMFMPPTLRRACLQPTDIRSTADFLQGVAQLGASLQELELRAYPGDWHARGLGETVCALPRLRKLAVGFVTLGPLAMQHVAGLPDLEELALGILTEDADALLAVGTGPRRQIFPSLSRLSVVLPEGHRGALLTFLRALSGESLQHLSITVGMEEYVSSEWETEVPVQYHGRYIDRVTEAVAKITGLRSLSIRTIEALHTIDEYTFTDDSLAPLLALKEMRSLAMSTHPTYVSSEALQRIQSSWPYIDTLLLGEDATRPGTPRLRVEDLLPLAKCKHLTRLGILIEGDVDLATLVDRVSDPSTSQLRVLQLGKSEISNPARLAVFLCTAFPSAILGPEHLLASELHPAGYDLNFMKLVNSFLGGSS